MDFRRKKIRGWKRRKRYVTDWKESHYPLDQDTVNECSRDYVKLWIYPFYSLNEYSLPNWYKKILIDSLIEIYLEWDKQLETTDNYYLKIWIFEDNFMNSQVVVAKDKYLNLYDNTFEFNCDIDKIPLQIRTDKSETLHWQEGRTIIAYYESDLLEDLKLGLSTQKEISKIKDSAFLIEEKEHGKVYYLRDDKVWIAEC